MRSVRADVLVCVAAATVLLAAAGAPEPSLSTVLVRAGTYVADFQRQLASIVAEERYVQDARARDRVEPMHVDLRSDLLLVKPAGGKEWVQLRDVFEVDGRPVRDRDERLTKLFLDPSAPAGAQIASILDESARYNIGTILRNVNTPVLPLMFLQPANQSRFKFKRTTDRGPAMTRDEPVTPGVFRVSTEVWVVQYEETEPGTFIRTIERKDFPARGRFWIEPATGRVVMSEIILENREVRATIDVSYQSEPLLGLLVPVEMRERYEGRRDRSRIEGRATYGRFRQIQVKVDEKIGPIK